MCLVWANNPIYGQSTLIIDQPTSLYAGPGHTYEQIDSVASGLPVVVKARNDIGNWLWVLTNSRQYGWLPIGYLSVPIGFQLDNIRVSNVLPQADLTRVKGELSTILYSAPILPTITQSMCQIYKQGIANGNQPNVVTKVGDSNSASPQYLGAIGRGDYDLGPYAFLQPTVDYFGPSLANQSMAARVGMNAASVFDPLWSSREHCMSGESPLVCEYRIHSPSIAVIMFGINDTKVLNSKDYTVQLQRVIEETLTHDILPIVVSFTSPPKLDNYEQVLRFNSIALELATEYHVPFVNFWAAAQALPRGGIGEDNVHLTQSGGRFVLGADETFYGLTLHNLLILHSLQRIYETCVISEISS